MVFFDSPWNFLILGHHGFIGKEIHNFLREERIKVLTISERMDSKNTQGLLSSLITTQTIVINCIASGVTPGTGSYEQNYQTNFELTQQLCDLALNLGAHGFIHFASNYELPRHIKPLASRTPYVETKSKGSKYCLLQIQSGRNVRLTYLPTVMGFNQPRGRFFRDFVTHIQEQIPFQIKYPAAQIEILTIPSMLKQLDLLNSSVKWGVHQVTEDLQITVLELAEILNNILIDIGERRVKLVNPDNEEFPVKQYESDSLQPYLEKYFANQLAQALGGTNE